MSRKGVLAVVSGFSGAGKGTLMKALLSEHADQYALSISATTRGPREGEVDGREYFFKTKDQFEQMIAEDALIRACLLCRKLLRDSEELCHGAAGSRKECHSGN